jgi:hypothetical protein
MSQLDTVALMAATLYAGLPATAKPQPEKQVQFYRAMARQAWELYFAVEDEELAATERHQQIPPR